MSGMGKRRADAASRRFLDEFQSVKVSRLRADGTIDPTKPVAQIPWPDGTTRLIGVKHNRLLHGGGYSFFVCPKCARRASKLWDIDHAPRCVKCCAKLNVLLRSEYGFGREARMAARDQALDQLVAKLETKEPLRFKTPPSWGAKTASRVYNSRKLTLKLRRAMVIHRLGALASQQAAQGDGLARSYQPLKDAKQITDLKPVWRAENAEALETALDKAQEIILNALNSDNPLTRIAAAKLIMRTKSARQRGLGG